MIVERILPDRFQALEARDKRPDSPRLAKENTRYPPTHKKTNLQKKLDLLCEEQLANLEKRSNEKEEMDKVKFILRNFKKSQKV